MIKEKERCYKCDQCGLVFVRDTNALGCRCPLCESINVEYDYKPKQAEQNNGYQRIIQPQTTNVVYYG